MQDLTTPNSIPRRQLSANQTYSVTLDLEEDARAEIIAELELLGLQKVSFTGTLSPVGGADWSLKAKLGATVTQPCVVTLAPVKTRIETVVTRRFLADMPELPEDEEEIEMPDDDSIEPLGAAISLLSVFREALALALPDYPRADGAELGAAVYAADGVTPMQDEDTKPFAGLADLKARLSKGEDG